jgi:hypothetical protein
VEKASVELAAKRGRSDFILHISRLGDIENRNVVPNLYKLYSVSVIYHLSVAEISGWYEAPFPQAFQDGTCFPSPRTHLSEFLNPPAPPATQQKTEELQATGLLKELPPEMDGVPGMEKNRAGALPLRVYRLVGSEDDSDSAARKRGNGRHFQMPNREHGVEQ